MQPATLETVKRYAEDYARTHPGKWATVYKDNRYFPPSFSWCKQYTTNDHILEKWADHIEIICTYLFPPTPKG